MGSQCKFCNTVTGEHGFAFGSDGKYHDDFELDEEVKPYFSDEPLPSAVTEAFAEAVLDYQKRVAESRPYEDTLTLDELRIKYKLL